MSTTSGFFSPAHTADNAKAVGSFTAVIPAAGTAQIINPADNMNAVTIMNESTVNRVRAVITFVAGVAGNATPIQQAITLPPGATQSLDFSNNPTNISGVIGAIESITLASVATPTTTAEASTYTVLTAAAGAILTLNFASN